MKLSVYSFQDLQVYQLAFRCSVEIYDLAQHFPEETSACLTRQILATSRAVRAHIAAAWGKRRDRKALITQLSEAQLKAAEMQTWIEAAVAVGYLDGDAGQALSDHYRRIFSSLDQLMEGALVGERRRSEDSTNDLPATA
ncbi:hypothetical protein XM38_004940 [Halomicronema hongdechloris C2206]|uniref:Four helix bundle protein n=1 Tax=Halomicronema hongdechloris C2206 TaxID=1641165 RepID=A0A1Z3HH82_9CYAN|nr:four helix bundle protein [Halomicronema hongdechloris]ASC69567.1 hypothetical protein XM38_004940 [Halomicronema hongdechloris C2206]